MNKDKVWENVRHGYRNHDSFKLHVETIMDEDHMTEQQALEVILDLYNIPVAN